MIWRLTLLHMLSVSFASTAKPWTRSCSSTMPATEALAGVDLTGKVYVITGADGNIASEVHKTLLKANATVVLTCRNPQKCQATKATILKETGGKVGPIELGTVDVGSKASIRQFATDMTTRHPLGIDGLINSAGVYSTYLNKDGLVQTMAVNVLGPALLTELMLPLLRGNAQRSPGRLVNVAAAVWDTKLPANTSAADLARWCTHVDPRLNNSGTYFKVSKFLMIHHAMELAKREPHVASFAVNPGLGVEIPSCDWCPQWLLRLPYPEWLRKKLGIPSDYHKACPTNFKGLAECPQKYKNSAAVVATAAAAPDIDGFSGSYLDFETKMLPPDAPQVFGPWEQSDPTCVPRVPPTMDSSLQAAWYDKMLQLMSSRDKSGQIIA